MKVLSAKSLAVLMFVAGAFVAGASPLEKQMESLNKVYKALRKEADPAKAAVLARDAQAIVAKGFSEVPKTVASMPEGPEKTRAAAGYRKMMGRLYVAFCEVEEAGLAGKADGVAKGLESLKALKKEGHNRFMED